MAEERHTPGEGAVREQLKESDPAEPDRTHSEARRADESARVTPADAEAAEAAGANGGEPTAESGEADEGSTLRRERDEYLELARRTQADFENYRKRATKDMAAASGRARVGLIRELLPVVDNLERALAAAPDDASALAEGVRLVLAELQGVLARTGVEAIEPSGAQFDPNVHEALTMREQEGADAGVVLDVVEKGYRTDDIVIRPARVIVAA